MMDQAAKLRQMIRSQESEEKPKDIIENKTRVIAVTSGKGGVGKTNVSINLAIHFSNLGQRVVILDADFGLANIEVLFGIVPNYTLADVINGNKNILEIMTEGPMGIKFISGGSGIQELAHLDQAQLNMFVENISLLAECADIVLIDTGAGISPSVINFLKAAHEILLITTPEPTSVADAYALIKTLHYALKKEDIHIQLLINRVDSRNEGMQVANKIKIVCKKFLELDLECIGYVHFDQSLVKAVKSQIPVAISYPKSIAAQNMKEIAMKLLDRNTNQDFTGIERFINKFRNIFSN